jgi:hypothetical protein
VTTALRGEELFEKVVEVSRLQKLLAPFALTRLLVRANVIPRHMTTEELARALPVLEEGLRVYLTEAELAAAMDDLRALAS